jgi:FkbM family methyltransferase
MSALLKISAIADRLGLLPWVARLASLAYPRQNFRVDAAGRWVNSQPEATLVSPNVHTIRFAEVERSVLDNWAWDYMPGPGDTIIDVGAGIGEEAVVFSRLVGPAGRIVAIEAHPETFACLEQSIARSGLENVTAINCAIADQDGELFISSGPSHLMNTVLGAAGGVKVPARTLDSMADFLKMNIEGAEKLAMTGFDRLAPRVAHAAISCHDFVATHFGGAPHYYTKDHVRSALQAHGFVVRSRPDAAESWFRDYLYAAR